MHRFGKPKILCPTCKTGQLEERTASEAHCSDCSSSYPVRNAVIDLLPESSAKRTLSQVFLEFKPFIHIYESRLWRKSPLLMGLLKISFEREQEVILQAVDPKGDQILLDLACGPGIHTRPLARKLRGGSIVGLDLSLPMLRYASMRAERERIDNIVFVHQDASYLPFPANEFDAVNCCGAIHLFPNLAGTLGEITRVLKPGGRFIAFTFKKQTGRFKVLVERLCQQLTGVRSFRPDVLAQQLKEAGLKDIECHHARGIGLLMSAFKPV